MDLFHSGKTIPLLRSLLPCVAPKERRLLTFLILIQQIQELQETIDDLQSGVLDAMPAPEEPGEQALFHALESVCSKEELQSLSQYKQMFQTMQMMQSLHDMEGCQEADDHCFSGMEGFDRHNNEARDSKEEEEQPKMEHHKSPADFFRDMLSPEQQHMVDAILEQNRGR